MTTAFPEEPDRRDDGELAADVPGGSDAEFTDIVADIEPYMEWPVSAADLDAAAARPTPEVDERKMRRQRDRELRAAELAAAADERASRAAEYAAEDGFTPPVPPPLRRPAKRTVLAVASILVGMVLLLMPTALPLSTTTTLIVGTVLVLLGAGVLFAGLPAHETEPGEGWDDRSEV